MLARLKKIFAAPPTQTIARTDLKIAAAALLVEGAIMDGDFGDDERAVVMRLLKERFQLTSQDAQALIAEAEETVAESNEIYTLSRTIKDNFEHAERVELIEMLWEVAYADGVLHDYETNLVRRLSGLLYVSDRESGDARKRVAAKMHNDGGPPDGT